MVDVLECFSPNQMGRVQDILKVVHELCVGDVKKGIQSWLNVGQLESTYHASKHAAAAAEHQNGDKISGNFSYSMVCDNRNYSQYGKIKGAHKQSPEKFPAAFTFPGKETGKKGYQYVDTYDTDRYDLLRQLEFVQHQGEQKEQAGGK